MQVQAVNKEELIKDANFLLQSINEDSLDSGLFVENPVIVTR